MSHFGIAMLFVYGTNKSTSTYLTGEND